MQKIGVVIEVIGLGVAHGDTQMRARITTIQFSNTCNTMIAEHKNGDNFRLLVLVPHLLHHLAKGTDVQYGLKVIKVISDGACVERVT